MSGNASAGAGNLKENPQRWHWRTSKVGDTEKTNNTGQNQKQKPLTSGEVRKQIKGRDLYCFLWSQRTCSA